MPGLLPQRPALLYALIVYTDRVYLSQVVIMDYWILTIFSTLILILGLADLFGHPVL